MIRIDSLTGLEGVLRPCLKVYFATDFLCEGAGSGDSAEGILGLGKAEVALAHGFFILGAALGLSNELEAAESAVAIDLVSFLWLALLFIKFLVESGLNFK